MSESWHSEIVRMWRDVETELARVNAFGRVPLRYRSATYGTSLDRMIRRLPTFSVESEDGRILQPLRSLKIEGGPNWVMALLESWALVVQVLGFYQERMANEGFLASAIQDISVRELLRMVDYQPFPGTAGTALSAFLASGAKGMPEVVEIPKGARIQGVPLGGQLPQVFQTTVALGSRAEWNRMPAFVPRISISPPIEGSSRTIELAGYETSLKPGDPLLLVFSWVGQDDVGPPVLRWIEKAKRKKGEALRLSSQNKNVPARRTLRGFDTPATDVTLTEEVQSGSEGELALQEAYRFSAQAHLFGYDAPKWSQVPDAVRRQYAPIQGGVQVSADDGSTWQSADQGLPELEIRCLAAIGPRLFAGTSKGLYRRSDDDLGSAGSSAAWTSITNGIGRVKITSITSLDGESSGDHVWVADSRGQVYQSSDGGGSFAPVQGRVMPQLAGIGALLRQTFDKLTAPLHLDKSPPARPSLPAGPVHSLAALADGDRLDLFAGTEKGVFSFHLPAGGWRPTSLGLPGADDKTGQAATAVRALLAEPAGALLLGCDKGLFRSTDRGRHWRSVSAGLPKETSVLCLTGYSDGRRRQGTYFAGTESGVYRSEDPKSGWSSASLGLIDPDPAATGPPQVEALSSRLDPIDLSHHVFAGTPAGLFRSTDRGLSWGQVESLQPISKIDAVASDRVGRILAAMPFAGFAADDWPGFHLLAGAIDLDRIYPHVVAGGWVVLRQPPSVGGTTEGIFRIRSVARVERDDFELSGLVSRLEVVDDGTLATFDLRTTTVYLSSVALEPWLRELPDLRPICGSQVRVSPSLKEIPEEERRMIVTGRRSRVKPRRGAWQTLTPAASLIPLPDPSESLQVFGWRQISEGQLVRVQDRLGRHLDLVTGSLQWMPAEEEDDVVGQAVNVIQAMTELEPPRPTRRLRAKGNESDAENDVDTEQTIPVAQDQQATSDGEGLKYTTLRFDESLALWLDPTTVTLWGNVAPSSQGETVSLAIGSGDAAKALQRFPIDSPVTYRPAETENGFRSTLEVTVAGALWREVPHLAVAAGDDHVYMVRPDLSGRAMVIFGDGQNGARLPTGRNNVEATFQSGMWPQALAPRQLSILQTRPLGLRHSDNPLPTEAGAPAEQRGESRARMPSWLRPLGRVVSLQDYQDFVSQNTEVALALVAPLVVRGHQVIQITIAGREGKWLAPNGEIFRQLVGSIDRQRTPGAPIRMQNYDPLSWLIGLRLQIEKKDDKAQVGAAVRSQIEARFGFEQASFGQSLFVGQLVDTALEVQGVQAAEAIRFGTVGSGWRENPVTLGTDAVIGERDSGFVSAPSGRLRARLAHVARARGESVCPAQLLSLAKVELELTT